MPDTATPTSQQRLLPWLVLGALLTIPATLAYLHHPGQEHNVWLVIPSVIGLLACTWGIAVFATSSRWSRVWWLLALMLFFSCLIRLLFYAVIAFAGNGFTAEVFLHFGWISFVSAWQEYPQLFLLISLLALLVPFSTRHAVKYSSTNDKRHPLTACLLGAFLMWIGSPAMPEVALAKASIAWHFPDEQSVETRVLSKWLSSPMLNVVVPGKEGIWAAAHHPRNLILLYIESGSIPLIQSEQHPGLMPKVSELVEKHSFVDHLHASGHVTIEGLINSMCGTLFPLDNGNNSLAAGENLAGSLPCLGDILNTAGYSQTFLGGFFKAFSGKGPFLESHGYDRVLGYDDLNALGMNAPEGHLAISDADLLDHSFLELERLRQTDRPFNLTILTIGSHFPGFVSPGCAPYGDGSDRFLNAVHCSDQLISNWVQRLAEEGWLDHDTVLVITGDHNVLPNPGIRRLFSDRMISDLRVPMIVIGDTAEPTVRHGAAYDLAPTLLDMLGIRSNVRFALGRSLLQPGERPDYFMARRGDVVGERWRDADAISPCDIHEEPYVPGNSELDSCERKELLSIIRDQIRSHSAPLPTIHCDALNPVEITVPHDTKKPMQFRLSGREQSRLFANNGSSVSETQKGLYLIRFDENGEFVLRTFLLPDAVSIKAIDTLDPQDGDLILAAWRPDGDARIDAASIPELVPANGGSTILKMTNDHFRVIASAPADETASLSGADCHQLQDAAHRGATH